METDLVPLAEGTDKGPKTVRVAQLERRMIQERRHPVQRVGQGGRGLEGEPFVDHLAVVLPAVIKLGQQLLALRTVAGGEWYEGSHGIGHVVRCPVLFDAEIDERLLLNGREIAETEIGQPALSAQAVIRAVWPSGATLGMHG